MTKKSTNRGHCQQRRSHFLPCHLCLSVMSLMSFFGLPLSLLPHPAFSFSPPYFSPTLPLYRDINFPKISSSNLGQRLASTVKLKNKKKLKNLKNATATLSLSINQKLHMGSLEPQLATHRLLRFPYFEKLELVINI